jgi:hypothetical protein
MSWLLVVVLVLLLAGLTCVCIVNAVRIKRDATRRLNDFRTRLEDEANSVLKDLLTRHPSEE